MKMGIKLASVLLFSVVGLSIAAPYGCVFEQSGFHYDLTGLSNSTSDYRISGPLEDFYLNMCIDVVQQCPLSDGCGACQVWDPNSSFGHACIGKSNTAQFELPDRANSVFRLTFMNGDIPPGQADPRTFEIDFFCDYSAGQGAPTFIEESPHLNYQFNWTTAFACPDASSFVGANISLVYATAGQEGLVGGRSGDVLAFTVQLVDLDGRNLTYNDTIASKVPVMAVVDNDLPTEQQFLGDAVYAGAGVFNVSYRYSGPHGAHTLTVRVNGVEVVGDSYPITITPGPISESSVVTFAAPSAVVGSVQAFNISLRDYSGAEVRDPCAETAFSLQLVGPNFVNPTIACTAVASDPSGWSGVYTAYTPAIYEVNFTVNGAAAASNPPTIRVNATTVNGSYATLFDVNGYLYNLTGLRNTVQDYYMEDETQWATYKYYINFGGPTIRTDCGDGCAVCQNAAPLWFCLGRTNTLTVSPAVVPGADGKGLSAFFGEGDRFKDGLRSVRLDFLCDWNATAGGPFNVSEGDIGSYSVQWRSAYACPVVQAYILPNASWSFEAPGQTGLTGGRSGDILSLSVQLVDKFGQNVTNDGIASRASVSIMLDAGLDTEQGFVGTYSGNGVFVVTYQYVGPVGPHNLVVYVLGEQAYGSPHVVEFATGRALASESFAVFPETTVPTAGAVHEFYVKLEDFSGNPVSNLTENTVTVTLKGPVTVVADLLPFNDSHIVGRYTTDVAGAYVVDVLVNGEAAQSLPPVVSVTSTGVPVVSGTTAVGNGLTPSPGAASIVILQLRDQYGNNITQNTTLAAWTSSLTKINGSTLDTTPVYMGNGLWSISYNLTVAGNYSLSVDLNQTAIPGSPFAIVLFPGPADPAMCSASGGGLTDAEAHKAASFKITSKDRWGNLRPNDNFTVYVVDGGDRVQNTPTLRNNHDGTYSGSYQVFVEGAYWLYIQVDGKDIAGSPFEIRCDSDANDIPPNFIDKLSTGQIIGIAAGCLVLTCVLTVAGFALIYRFCFSRKKDYDRIIMS
eukprot:TRINITY_DN1501_c0_g1_i2.p1 TRINITY_DN1501_c0_g1~~TRINITY_DN1501_c0_g1_i2.p1  ORF type:complete len:1036 (-),score=192.18 TRINITY_DN1501_c0_g1_i2:712-3765(-)